MLVEGSDGAAATRGGLQSWGCAAPVALGCGLGRGDPLVPSEEGEKDLAKWPEAPWGIVSGPQSSTDLAWEAGSRLLRCQEAAGNVRLIGDRGWPGGELRKGWGAGCGGREGVREGPGAQEAGT